MPQNKSRNKVYNSILTPKVIINFIVLWIILLNLGRRRIPQSLLSHLLRRLKRWWIKTNRLSTWKKRFNPGKRSSILGKKICKLKWFLALHQLKKTLKNSARKTLLTPRKLLTISKSKWKLKLIKQSRPTKNLGNNNYPKKGTPWIRPRISRCKSLLVRMKPKRSAWNSSVTGWTTVKKIDQSLANGCHKLIPLNKTP